MTFEFFRFRFHFRALDALFFPPGKSTNVLRGAFGTLLRGTATPAEYARLFRPGTALGRSPSGLADWPRPFVFRASHLDALHVPVNGGFFVDVHVFDLHTPALPLFRTAFAQLAVQGMGPGRGRADLVGVDRLDLEDHATPAADSLTGPTAITLDPEPNPSGRVRVRFVTPTELKTAGHLAEQPDFPVLFGRLRDRISTLRSLYGTGPLDLDFHGMAERAAQVRMAACQLAWAHLERKSGRTGQVHPLGGFTGEAEYSGELAEFTPFLHAARWVGVGRHTVWGKGDLRVLPLAI
ncbi:MAG TPA: CRISPR system precrRNA processing endoribonuclease RAMP protein Cas6 [Bryobacteraceae bacterium]|nr:CRISPR system precrRNA processing endoribonuclease RAMP protein Cas6 [Bryobacteraceae bacterium]